jgi:hypothetical protein
LPEGNDGQELSGAAPKAGPNNLEDWRMEELIALLLAQQVRVTIEPAGYRYEDEGRRVAFVVTVEWID